MTIILTTAAIFLLTLTLVLIKPKGLNEAWAAVIGGALMLLLHAVTPVQAVRTILSGGSVLLFLLGLLILSSLLKESGFFEWSRSDLRRHRSGKWQDALPKCLHTGKCDDYPAVTGHDCGDSHTDCPWPWFGG